MADKTFEYKVTIDNPSENSCFVESVTGTNHRLTDDGWLLVEGLDDSFYSFPVSRIMQFGREPIEQEQEQN